MRIFWIICLSLLIVLLIALTIYLLVGYGAYRVSLTRKGKIKKTIENHFAKHLKENNEEEIYYQHGFEQVEIISEDNLKLCGFYKNKNCNKIALIVHGYGGNHIEMADYAKIFEKRGYDILAIDHRCHGKSEGDDLTMGLNESKDLILWIKRMIEINPQYKIVLFGVSMGASTICMACGEQLPQNVVLAIEDCGYDSAYKQFLHVFRSKKMKFKLLFNIFYNFTKKTKNFDLRKVNPAFKLKNSKIPIMFIHGGDDKFVLTDMVYNLSSQVPDHRKYLYVVPNAGHAASYLENPKKYENEVYKFLSLYYM